MENAELQQLVEEGLSQRAIATRLGVSWNKVRGLLVEAGLTTKASHSPSSSFTREQVEELVPSITSWTELQDRLQSLNGTRPSWRSVRTATSRYRLDVSHFESERSRAMGERNLGALPDLPPRMSDFAEFMAAAWYSSRGAKVSMTSAARYDLIADFAGDLRRVQVKSSGADHTVRLQSQRYSAESPMHANGRREMRGYTEDEIDEFFIVCADGPMYRMPLEAVSHVSFLRLPGRYVAFEVRLPGDLHP